MEDRELLAALLFASMKAPPKRRGNLLAALPFFLFQTASMKAPPKRRGNGRGGTVARQQLRGLNESPSKKEGKLGVLVLLLDGTRPQ